MVLRVKAYLARVGLGLALIASWSSATWAAEGNDEEPTASESDAPEPEKKSDRDAAKSSAGEAPKSAAAGFGHGHQFGLRVGLVGAYHMVLRYDKSPFCHDYMPEKGPEQLKFCGFAAPFALDLALSGALIDSFEPFLWARLGLGGEKETNTLPLLVLGLGTRIYTMSDSALKVFVEPAVGVELEGKGDSKDPFRDAVSAKYYRTDLLLHLAAGPHFDVHENFGFYADAGLTLGLLRYLHTTLELSVGIQGRVP
jgi:hypothetical protein